MIYRPLWLLRLIAGARTEEFFAGSPVLLFLGADFFEDFRRACGEEVGGEFFCDFIGVTYGAARGEFD